MEPYTGSFRLAGSLSRQTCKQCRLRKVRCDGNQSVCGHCSRLGYACSFSRAEDSGAPEEEDPAVSLPRRRTGVACHHCRDHKIKCSGQLPKCSNCIRRNLACSYPTTKRRIRSPRDLSEQDLGAEHPPDGSADQLIASPEDQSSFDGSQPRSPLTLAPPPGRHASTPANPVHGSRQSHLAASSAPFTASKDCFCYSSWAEDAGRSGKSNIPVSVGLDDRDSNEFLLPYLDLFFALEYPLPSYSFLHPASTKARCAAGNLDRALAFAIFGLVKLRARSPAGDGQPAAPECSCRGIPWIDAAEGVVWQHLESPTISRIQALLLVINHRMETGRFQRAFMLASLAARFAVAIRLNHERRDLSFVSQEVRRRIMWNLKLVERYFSIGLPEFELCPFEVIYVQLPSREDEFGAEPPGDGGAYRICVSLESIRRDAMKLNRDVAPINEPFTQLVDVVHGFESKLASIAAQMPRGTDFSFTEIAEVVESPWLARHVFMHLSWHQSHCDVYRLLLPGFQEAAPQPILAALSAEFLAHAEAQCLRHASAIINTLTSLNQQSLRPSRLEFDSAICAYQASRLVLFISRFGKGRERPTPEFATSRAELCLVALNRFFATSALVKPIIDEIGRTIKAFVSSSSREDATITLSGRASPAPPEEAGLDSQAATRAQQKAEMQSGRERLAIHSLLRRAEFSDGDEADEAAINVITDTARGSTARSFEAVFRRQGFRWPEQGRPQPPQATAISPGLSLDGSSRLPVAHSSALMPGTGGNLTSSLAVGLEDGQLAATDDWELDSFAQSQGWDMQFPLFPWYGLQDQDWFSRNN